jgi:hypothetical protein
MFSYPVVWTTIRSQAIASVDSTEANSAKGDRADRKRISRFDIQGARHRHRGLQLAIGETRVALARLGRQFQPQKWLCCR